MQTQVGKVDEIEDFSGKVLELIRTERKLDKVRESSDPFGETFELIPSKEEVVKVFESEEGVRDRVVFKFVASEIELERDDGGFARGRSGKGT